MRPHRLLAAVLFASMSAVACSNLLDNSPSTTGPMTDTFSGSLSQGNSLTFTYTVATTGTVSVTLTAVSPATTSALGLGIGSSSGGTCTVTNSTSAAVAGSAAQLSATETPGTYCVKVSDVGNLTTTSTVTVTVAHS